MVCWSSSQRSGVLGLTAATAGAWAQFRRVLVFVSLLSPEAKERSLGSLGSVLREGCSGSGRLLRITTANGGGEEVFFSDREAPTRVHFPLYNA